MYDQVNELRSRVGNQSLGRDRWGRNYWLFSSLPCVYVERSDSESITEPCDHDTSLPNGKVGPSQPDNLVRGVGSRILSPRYLSTAGEYVSETRG